MAIGEIGFRASSYGTYVGGDVSGTLDCDHVNSIGNGSPCILVKTLAFKAGQSADGGLGLEWECSQTLQRTMSALEPTILTGLNL